MFSSASAALSAMAKPSILRTIAAHASAVASSATTYLQTMWTKYAISHPIGRPAYQNAGITRAQNETVHATAIPAGPQGNARIKNRTVTTVSTTVHRSQRSGLPIDKWIQPTAL